MLNQDYTWFDRIKLLYLQFDELSITTGQDWSNQIDPLQLFYLLDLIKLICFINLIKYEFRSVQISLVKFGLLTIFLGDGWAGAVFYKIKGNSVQHKLSFSLSRARQ